METEIKEMKCIFTDMKREIKIIVKEIQELKALLLTQKL